LLIGLGACFVQHDELVISLHFVALVMTTVKRRSQIFDCC